MSDETPDRSSEIRDAGRSDQGRLGAESPLQTRAAFLANWGWESVTRHNLRMCERGRAQHGANSESQGIVAEEWTKTHRQSISLIETLDFLRQCHRSAPFLFLNGNTFADIGRTLSDFLFAELPTSRRRQATSAVAHYIAGVVDRQSMIAIVEELCASADFQVGDRVKTLKGSMTGTVEEILPDGRLRCRMDSGTVLIALPESVSKIT